MTTLSVPLTDGLHAGMTAAIAQGLHANYADFARQAIKKYLEELAVKAVLDAEHEPSLNGDLRELANKL